MFLALLLDLVLRFVPLDPLTFRAWEAMLRRYKLDRADLFGQLIVAGQDLVGALTVNEVK